MPRTDPAQYCSPSQARKMATFIPVKDLTDSDVNPYIEAAMDEVDRETGRTGTYWHTAEENFGSVVYITILLTAAALVRHYGPLYLSAVDAVKNAEALEKLAEKELEKLSEVMAGGGGGSGVDDDIPTATTNYSTLEAARMENPSQTTVTAYRSTDFV